MCASVTSWRAMRSARACPQRPPGGLSRLHWYCGNGRQARATAAQAVEILEPLGDSAELARAYGGLAQLAMLNDDTDAAAQWGHRALELAGRVGDEFTHTHTLVSLAT